MAFPPKTPLHAPTVSTTLQHYLEVSPLGLSLISFLPFPCYNDALTPLVLTPLFT